MTVSELIAGLSELDPDLKVWAEGCDCTNKVVAVDVVGSRFKRVVLEVGLH